MKRSRTVTVTAILAATFFVMAAGASSASAVGDPVVGKQVLDELCVAKGGQPIYSPYAISRCQGARSNKGFDLEQTTCEGLLDGEFVAVEGTVRNNRTNWSCIPQYPL